MNNKGFGQCFLINEKILNKIATICDLNNKEVVEIGPGTGNLTKHLTNYKSLTLYEIDTRFISLLKQQFPNATIINENCLNVNINTNIIISNLPYGISTAFCKNLILKYEWNECVLLVQKELAEKLCDIYNSLGFILNTIATVKIIHNVTNVNFKPKPQVMSSIIYIKKHYHNYDVNQLWNFITELYTYSRKKLPIKYKPYNEYRSKQLTHEQILQLYTLLYVQR